MTMVERARPSKLNVFISYSRDDLAFADQLDAALQITGFATTIDRHGISGGENWRQRLGAMIRDADTIAFVVSPSSAKSAICGWEVEQAALLNKRILPVVCRPLDQGQSPHPQLSELNYILFYPEPRAPGSGFGVGLGQLVVALRADLEWLREHTRLLQRALEWHTAGRPPNRLLTGADISTAKAWAAARSADAPELTALHVDFIQESERGEIDRAAIERERLKEMAAAQTAKALALAERETAVQSLSRRTAAGLVGAGTLTAVATGLAYWGVNAEARFRQARADAEAAAKGSAETVREHEARRTDIEGQLTAYAASPGQMAADGPPGSNSPYTSAVLSELRNSTGPLQEALARAHHVVLNTSQTHQRPLLSSDLNGNVYLTRRSPTSKRMALIITVGRIGANEISVNPKLDGEAWLAFLSGAGFETKIFHEASLIQCLAVMRSLPFSDPNQQDSLTDSLTPERQIVRTLTPFPDTILFVFYAGAGLYEGGNNYLAMSDTSFEQPDKIIQTLLPVARLLDWARRAAAASIVVLDTNFSVINRPGTR